MGVRGLGSIQIKERKKTDIKVLSFIKSNPACYTRQIIKGTSISPNSVTASLRRLKNEKKIITHKESKFFKDSKVPPRAIAYIPRYSNEQLEKNARVSYLRKEIDNLEKFFPRMAAIQSRERKPKVIRLANLISTALKKEESVIIEKMQKNLGIQDVNESMIGLYIYNLYFEIDKPHDLPWAINFYYKMLPRKYCLIDISSPKQLIDFIKKNFPCPLDVNDLIENKFSYFNKKTRKLAYGHIEHILTAKHKEWLSLHGFTN